MSKVADQRNMTLTIDVPADRDTVWDMLTQGAGLANWFPPFAQADQGPGAKVHLSWGGDMAWDTFVSQWVPGEHLQWKDDPNDDNPNALVVDFYLESLDGVQTRVKLVQSGFFGSEEEWDEQYQSMHAGWTYFLHALGHYLRYHTDRARHTFSERRKFSGTREQIWQRVVLASGGLLLNAPPIPEIGLEVDLRLSADNPVCGVIEVLVPQRAIAFRLPEHDNALLFVEIEPGASNTTCGFWLSTYDRKASDDMASTLQAKVNELAQG